MKKEKYTKNEHFIPNFLLRLFKDEDGRLYYLNKKRLNISTCSPDNACFQEDIYETKRNFGKSECYILRNDIEDKLSIREDRYSNLCRKIIQICDNPDNLYIPILHGEEKELLAEFIINLHLRNPDKMSYYKSILSDKLKSTDGFFKELEYLKKESPDENITKILDGAVEYNLKQTIVLPNNEKGVLNHYKSELLSKGSYCILKSCDDGFIISDNIASVSENYFMFIPISPRYAVMVSFDKYFKNQSLKRHNRIYSLDTNSESEMILKLYQESKKYIYGQRKTLEKIKNLIDKKNIPL